MDVIVVLDLEIGKIIKRKKKKIRDEEDTVEGVLNVIGFDRALRFVRKHADVLADATFNGFSEEVFGDEPPAIIDASRLSIQEQRTERNLALNKSSKWYNDGLEALEKSGRPLRRFIAKDYWMVVNKLLEKEAKGILKNFKENAIAFLDFREFDTRDPEGNLYPIIPAYVDLIIEGYKKHILYGRMTWKQVEKEFVAMERVNREGYQNARTKAKQTVMRQVKALSLPYRGRGIRLVQGQPEHRQIIRTATRQLLDRMLTEYQSKKEFPSDKALRVRAENLIMRELERIRSQIARREREAQEAARQAGAPDNARHSPTREERMAVHDRSQSRVEQPAAAEQRQERQAPEIRQRPLSPFERRMNSLREQEGALADFFERLRERGLGKPKVKDLISKVLHKDLVQTAVKAAVVSGFERRFGSAESIVMVQLISFVGKQKRKPEAFQGFANRRCPEKAARQAILKFLFKNHILEWHHAETGRGPERRVVLATHYPQLEGK